MTAQFLKGWNQPGNLKVRKAGLPPLTQAKD